MLVTNNGDATIYLGLSAQVELTPGVAVTVANALYAADSAVAKELNALYLAGSVSVTSPPANFPRWLGSHGSQSRVNSAVVLFEAGDPQTLLVELPRGALIVAAGICWLTSPNVRQSADIFQDGIIDGFRAALEDSFTLLGVISTGAGATPSNSGGPYIVGSDIPGAGEVPGVRLLVQMSENNAQGVATSGAFVATVAWVEP